MVCSACGTQSSEGAQFCAKCGIRLEGGAAPTRPARIHAGFWRRYTAGMIDLAVLGGVTFVAAIVALALYEQSVSYDTNQILLTGIISLALFIWAYFAIGESQPGWGTVGKRLMGITVVNKDGGPLGVWRATVRLFARIISALPLLLGFLLPAFTSKRQAPHDMISGALVVARDASPRDFAAPPATMKFSGAVGGMAVITTVIVLAPVAIVANQILQDYQPVLVWSDALSTPAQSLSDIGVTEIRENVEVIPSEESVGGGGAPNPKAVPFDPSRQ
jgi:uncharacterized RDD family membrane protein YckC